MLTNESECYENDQLSGPCLPESMGRRASPVLFGSSPSLGSYPTYLQSDPNLSDQEEENDRDALDVANVPMSSSPPDFTSSSPYSYGSTESEETSTSNSSLSSSPADPSTSEGFGQKLHQLLLVALKERKLRDRTNFSFYSDSSLSRTPEISSFSCFEKWEDNEKNDSGSLKASTPTLSYGEISPINFEDSQNLMCVT